MYAPTRCRPRSSFSVNRIAQLENCATKSGLLEARKVARSSNAQLAAHLAQHLYLGRTFTWDTQLEQRIATATPADIQAALRRFIDPSHFVTIKAGDFP
jgi:zinc protease